MWFCIGLPNFIRIRRSATELWRRINLPRWRPRRRESTSDVRFGDVLHLRTSKTIGIPNFATIAQSATKILLFPVSEKTAAILKFYFRLHFDVFVVIGMWFCVGLPNFIRIGWLTTELWCHINLPRWRPQHRKYTSRFRLMTYPN